MTALAMLGALKPVLYVQLSPELLTVRNVKTGKSMSEVPELALSRGSRPQVVAVGAEVRNHRTLPVDVVNPFAHPRSMVSDFTAGEQVLKAFVARMVAKHPFAAAPRMVLHLLGEPAGGYTQVEIRAFQEMARGAGASDVQVWQGRALGDQEILAGSFSSGGRLLA